MFSPFARGRLQPLWPVVLSVAAATASAETTYQSGWIELTDGSKLDVEIAATSQQRERGLMFRTTLDENHGMLFVYPQVAKQAVWMKNTLIALDVVFIDENSKIVSIQKNLAPCQQDPCPIYLSTGKVSYMLEVAAGSADKRKLLPGQQLIIDYRHH